MEGSMSIYWQNEEATESHVSDEIKMIISQMVPVSSFKVPMKRRRLRSTHSPLYITVNIYSQTPTGISQHRESLEDEECNVMPHSWK